MPITLTLQDLREYQAKHPEHDFGNAFHEWIKVASDLEYHELMTVAELEKDVRRHFRVDGKQVLPSDSVAEKLEPLLQKGGITIETLAKNYQQFLSAWIRAIQSRMLNESFNTSIYFEEVPDFHFYTEHGEIFYKATVRFDLKDVDRQLLGSTPSMEVLYKVEKDGQYVLQHVQTDSQLMVDLLFGIDISEERILKELKSPEKQANNPDEEKAAVPATPPPFVLTPNEKKLRTALGFDHVAKTAPISAAEWRAAFGAAIQSKNPLLKNMTQESVELCIAALTGDITRLDFSNLPHPLHPASKTWQDAASRHIAFNDANPNALFILAETGPIYLLKYLKNYYLPTQWKQVMNTPLFIKKGVVPTDEQKQTPLNFLKKRFLAFNPSAANQEQRKEALDIFTLILTAEFGKELPDTEESIQLYVKQMTILFFLQNEKGVHQTSKVKALLQQAEVLSNVGEAENALATYKAILEIDPNNETATQKLAAQMAGAAQQRKNALSDALRQAEKCFRRGDLFAQAASTYRNILQGGERLSDEQYKRAYEGYIASLYNTVLHTVSTKPLLQAFEFLDEKSDGGKTDSIFDRALSNCNEPLMQATLLHLRVIKNEVLALKDTGKKQKDFETAEAAYRAILGKDKNSIEANFGLALLLLDWHRQLPDKKSSARLSDSEKLLKKMLRGTSVALNCLQAAVVAHLLGDVRHTLNDLNKRTAKARAVLRAHSPQDYYDQALENYKLAANARINAWQQDAMHIACYKLDGQGVANNLFPAGVDAKPIAASPSLVFLMAAGVLAQQPMKQVAELREEKSDGGPSNDGRPDVRVPANASSRFLSHSPKPNGDNAGTGPTSAPATTSQKPSGPVQS